MQILYKQLAPSHFNGVIALGNAVHGDNYLNAAAMHELYEKSFHNGINASWVAVALPDATGDSHPPLKNQLTNDGLLVGFRLTIAAPHWQPDKWCTPERWKVPISDVCYFKCNTVDERMRGEGVGSTLLKHSIGTAHQQNAKAGLAHIWMASPNNSAFGYFSACGGKVIEYHPGKWLDDCFNNGYVCPVCDHLCDCVAAEMLLTFE